jgi:BirA family transcriptional regulator, biotin operon repressor / biotin---[acetyl-CoA-carboxylase] ligase
MSAFSQSDLAELESHDLIDRLVFHEQSGSTNDLAKSVIPAAGETVLFLSELQTGGRGRGENSWSVSEGSLTFSLLVDTRAFDIPMSKRPLLPLASGVAVRDAIFHILPDEATEVKWPNDVMLNGRKLAGILVEPHECCEHHVIIGVGMNVGNVIDDADLRSVAISLADFDVKVSRTSVLMGVLIELAGRLSQVRGERGALIDALNACSYLQGKEIRINAAGHVSRGRCRRIDRDGALILDNDGSEHRYLAGSVELA